VIWALTISGPPRTKKTSNVMALAGGRRIVLPSAAWRKWVKSAGITFQDPQLAAAWYANGPILCPVTCRALFYRDARRGDLVGFMQGLADLLEQREILTNDRLIESWDGTRLLLDRTRPRVEVLITPIEQQEAIHGAEDTAPASTKGQR
jgi:hypothetical protein